MPRVSVIIPAYNQGAFLGEAIQSVLDQSDPDFEILVVDDGSTDNTREVVAAYTDERVRYLFQTNQGLSAARNTGVQKANGRYLTFLDSDDLFMPEKLALLNRVFDEHPAVGMAAGQAILIDIHGQPIGQSFHSQMPQNSAELLLGNPFHVGSVMVDRVWQEKAGLFDQSLRSYEDWDLWLRMVRLGCEVHVIEDTVSRYRFHPAQMTRNGKQMTNASFAVLEKVYKDPELPEAWRALHDRAYANAHLRAAAQAYIAQDFENASSALASAIELDPHLMANDAGVLSGRLAAWTNLPKMSDPVEFLDGVYSHLPPQLATLRRRRAAELSELAIRLAFEAHHKSDPGNARKRAWQAVRYQPARLFNLGVLSILLKS